MPMRKSGGASTHIDQLMTFEPSTPLEPSPFVGSESEDSISSKTASPGSWPLP